MLTEIQEISLQVLKCFTPFKTQLACPALILAPLSLERAVLQQASPRARISAARGEQAAPAEADWQHGGQLRQQWAQWVLRGVCC